MKRTTRELDRFLLALAVLLTVAVLLCAFMTACSPDEVPPDEPSADGDGNGDNGDNGGSGDAGSNGGSGDGNGSGDGGEQGGGEQVDTEITLRFEEHKASVDVVSSRDIVLMTSSNDLLIEGEGEFTVSVDGGEALASTDGKLEIENTADVHTSVKLTVTVESSMSLSFTLLFDPGTEGAPYVIASSGETLVEYTKEAFIKIETSGWYSFTGENYKLTNYNVTADAMYLAAGVYGMGVESADAAAEQISITVRAEEAPDGYTAERPVTVTLEDNATLIYYAGVEAFYSFTAEKDGVYRIAPGSDGKSQNARFALSSDGYARYYGRYYDGEAFEICDGGTACTLFLAAGDTVTVKLDYTMSEDFVGSDTVTITVSEEAVTAITELDKSVSGQLEKRGKVWYTFTASTKGLYNVLFGMGDIAEGVRFTTTLDEAGTYYYSPDDIATLRLDAGQKVLIAVDGTSASVKGGFTIKVASGGDTDPLPAGVFASGTYDGSFTIVIDRDALTVTHGAFAPVGFKYLDGEVTYEVTMSGQSTTYTLVMADNGVDIVLSYVNSRGTVKKYPLTYKVPVEPVDIEDFEGVYKSADGSELFIYDAGDGIYVSATESEDGEKSYSYDRHYTTDSSFGYEDNIIKWGAISISIKDKTEDGKIQTVTVTSYGKSVDFERDTTRTAVRPPVSLYADASLKQVDYNGEEKDESGVLLYALSYSGGDRFNGFTFTIVAKDGDTYTIYAYTPDMDDRAVYKLKLSGENIIVYDEDDTLLDVLTPVSVAPPPALKADESNEDTTTCVGGSGESYLKVTKSGWYTFFGNGSTELMLECSLDEDGVPSCSWTNKKYSIGKNGFPVKLDADTLIAVYNGTLTAKYSETAPQGTEENPYVITSDSLVLTDKLNGDNVIYVKYTAAEEEKYVIKMSVSGMHFVVNDIDYGQYLDGFSFADHTAGSECVLVLKKDESIIIAVNRASAGGNSNVSISVKVYEEPIEDDGKLDFEGFESTAVGEYTGEVSGTAVLVRINADNIDISYGSDTVSAIVPEYFGTYYTATATFGGTELSIRLSFEDGALIFSCGGGDTETTLTRSLIISARTGEYSYTEGETWCKLTVSANTVTYEDSTGKKATNVVIRIDGKNYAFTCDDGTTVKFGWNEKQETFGMLTGSFAKKLLVRADSV